MKRRIRIHPQPLNVHAPLLAVILITVVFISSGSSMIPQTEPQSDAILREKKLGILEKLEKGSMIKPDEIRESFSRYQESAEVFIPFGDEFEDLFENLRIELGKCQHQLGNLRHSEEFENAMEQFRKEKEIFRKDLEKIREEMKKMQLELGEISKGIII